MSRSDPEPSHHYRRGDVKVKKQALTTITIETLAPGTSVELNEVLRAVSAESGVNLSQPKTRQRATLDWFIETLALAGGAMAGIYVGAWLDAPDLDPDSGDAAAKE
jgi:hypothetical protein